VEKRSLLVEMHQAKFDIPAEFFSLDTRDPFAFLLHWNLVLDHFENVTIELKTQYLEQLRESRQLDTVLTFIFGLLRESDFDLAGWDYVAFQVEYSDPESSTSNLLFAAHIYYRCLTLIPSYVRILFAECKVRGLALFIEAYTQKYYSPRIVKDSFQGIVRDQDPFFVKTTDTKVSCEYKVEEAAIILDVIFPSVYPLRLVQVDGKTAAGIAESKWRSWLLNFASLFQLSYSLNQALAHFKKNLDLHFEGIEDCAICNFLLT
jgi:hypothetical protein